MREDWTDDDDTEETEPARSWRGWWRRRVSTLTLVTVLFFLGIGVLLTGVYNYGEMIVTVGRGSSILILGVGFIIALNLIAIGLMLVLLKTIKGQDD
ncbi:hypothetical protein [Roseospira navarrensis]|uniref:Uncharacterized protein n=1 Tax=Roseospira navarrensis TaxID=140058 RepID=A0A7X1ZHI5_9PROT|nr:hypothetical protein [Roseospira navarrensis]MQX38089.1 hypothetical protein [Roseospira navarrensis]